MGKPHNPVVLALAAFGVAASASCLDPTQITLEISTDAPCADTKGTTFIGGGAGVNARSAPNATSTRCIDGDLGTLVATPSDNKDADARFIIVTGIDRPSRECTPDNKYKGCIVQRRALRYPKHKPVSLPIKMWLICKDVECDEDSTCARNGKCVPARIADPDACASRGCFPDGDPDPDADGGSSEGGLLDEAGLGGDGAGRDWRLSRGCGRRRASVLASVLSGIGHRVRPWRRLLLEPHRRAGPLRRVHHARAPDALQRQE